MPTRSVRQDIATRRYLQRHIAPGLPECSAEAGPWQHVVVVPAYRESPSLIARLSQLPRGSGRTLVILVINRPDSDLDANTNSALREALGLLPEAPGHRADCNLRRAGAHTDIAVLDLESGRGPLPAAQGVGLARKTGADLALLWMHAGRIHDNWICNTDADATLPSSYFAQLASAPDAAVAATFPFVHSATQDAALNTATCVYELRLHYYLRGLEHACSPYAWHSLGSCLAVRKDAYAQVRGFPRRAAAEDFYLLNKLTKLGEVARLRGACVRLEARASNRVPFGTGPAVSAITLAAEPDSARIFEHPMVFEALRVFLRVLPRLCTESKVNVLPHQLSTGGLPAPLALAATRALETLKLSQALEHCRRQSRDAESFQRHFHQWFDAFRTLRFLRELGRAGWPPMTLQALYSQEPVLWPQHKQGDLQALRLALTQRWGWEPEKCWKPAYQAHC
tara:strand:- start:19748 stop:21106 length:1359 start_codon:yes stop_codon:yes gene_type:complete